MARSPRSVRHLLQDKPTLKRLTGELADQQALLADVRHCLPDDLAARCVSARLHDGQLVLHTGAAVWATRLRFLAPQLASVLKTAYPTLNNVKVHLFTDRLSAPTRSHIAHHSTAAATIIHGSAEHANSEALRESLRRLAKAVRPAGEE